jgi:hypothetical protein
MAKAFEIDLERGEKRVFAIAVDWPGWSRSGRSEDEALETLVVYGERYARVAKRASIAFSPPSAVSQLTVGARLKGGGGTDFGVPGVVSGADNRAVKPRDVERLEALLKASWATFDGAASKAKGVTLRTGPRGGGRDLAKMIGHVLDAEHAYLGELGAKRFEPPQGGVAERMAAVRQAELEMLAAIVAGERPVPGPRRKKPFWRAAAPVAPLSALNASHSAVQPPSTRRTVPVTMPAAGEAR